LIYNHAQCAAAGLTRDFHRLKRQPKIIVLPIFFKQEGTILAASAIQPIFLYKEKIIWLLNQSVYL
jgi:hypothetical protein